MKSISNFLFKLAIFSLFSFYLSYQSFGQEKINLSAGIGFPELLNAGIRYQLEQSQIAIGFGFIPIKEENVISVSGDYFYHFGGFSKLSNRRPWYGRIGMVYFREETNTLIDNYLSLNSRLGREINVSKRIGVQVDVGANHIIFKETKRKQPSSGWSFDIKLPPILPSFGMCVFYRL